jgi:hypothetical protein
MMPSGQEQQGHTGRYCHDQKEGSAPVKTTGGAMLQHWIFLDFAAVVFHGVLRTREICRRRTLTAPIIMNPSNRKG